jgi:predicted DNA-binding protein
MRKDVVVTFRVTEEEAAKLRQQAKHREMTVSTYLRQAVQEYLWLDDTI